MESVFPLANEKNNENTNTIADVQNEWSKSKYNFLRVSFRVIERGMSFEYD